MKQSKLCRPKTADLRRLKEKLLENEKQDKDDSSSTTTETSSIEAEDKVLGEVQLYQYIESEI